MVDHRSEHTGFCAIRNIESQRRHMPGDKCPTCIAWRDGYQAALEELEDDDPTPYSENFHTIQAYEAVNGPVSER